MDRHKKILMLNWRCPTNPKSGGAEKVTRIHCAAWVKAGWDVTWLSGNYPGAKKEEIIDGINIVRVGTPKSIYWLAPYIYWLKYSGRFDLVIDQIHGLPFLSTIWAWRSKKLVFIHEVAQEIWDEMWPFPINILGKLYEKLYFRLFYQHTPFWVDCQSTADDLVRYGIKREKINIIPCGIDIKPVAKIPQKEKSLTLIFVSRLVKMKGIEDAIKVFVEVKKQIQDAKFWIVGNGELDYVKKLKNQVSETGYANDAIFFGFVSEKKKIELLGKAHFLVHTSVREGFGLVILEANSQGTPCIVYNSPGLRDLVRNSYNGYQTPQSNIKLMAKQTTEIWYNKKEYYSLVVSSVKEINRYNWIKLTQNSVSLIDQL